MNELIHYCRRKTGDNSRFAKAWFSHFYDSEVLNSSFVHLVKYSAKTPRLNAKPETVTPPFQTTTQQENITNFTDLHLSDPPQKKSSSAIPPQPHSIRIR